MPSPLRPVSRGLVLVLVAAACAGVSVQSANAICNTIPSALRTFRGAVGTVDRPFALSGQFLELRLDPAQCNIGTPGFDLDPTAHVVTLVFTPPDGPRNVVVLASDCAALQLRLAACATSAGVTPTCIAVNGPGEPPSLAVAERDGIRRLQVRFPDTDALVGPTGDRRGLTGPVAVVVRRADAALPCEVAARSCATGVEALACVDELFARDGTCLTSAAELDTTFGHLTALPPANDFAGVCTAPSPPCTGTATDILFAVDRAGNALVPIDWRGVLVDSPGTPIPRLVAGSTALEAFADDVAPIRIPGDGFTASYTLEGALLPPIFEPQLAPGDVNEASLFGSVDAPVGVMRIARRQLAAACVGGAADGAVCTTVSNCPSGTCGRALRFFQCTGGALTGLPCTAGADCPGGTCGPTTTCADGDLPDAACASDGDCPAGECGPALFEFRDRLVGGGIGPVVLTRVADGAGVCTEGSDEGAVCVDAGGCQSGVCVDFRAEAQDAVPLDGIARSEDVFAFTIEESISNIDVTGDADALDSVLLLRERVTGVPLPTGAAGAAGVAISRVHDGPYAPPAIAAEGAVVAFLQPEPQRGDCATPAECDGNGDGDILDTLLRVFRETGGVATELTPAVPITADALPVIDRRSLAVSNGRVFFRRPEWASAGHTITRVSVASDGTQGNGASVFGPGMFGSGLPGSALFVSATGRFAVFASAATNLVPDDTNVSCNENGDAVLENCPDVFIHDRDADGNGIFDEVGIGKRLTVRVSVATNGAQGNGKVGGFFDYAGNSVSCTSDGRHVVFVSTADTLAPNTLFLSGAYVRDRDVDGNGVFDEPGGVRTIRASTNDGGFGADSFVDGGMLSEDGRQVVFVTRAKNLVENDENGKADIFVHDRDADGDGVFDEVGGTAIRRIVGFAPGQEANGDARASVTMSPSGRFVGFGSSASNLVNGDTNGTGDVFVADRDIDEDGVFDEDGATEVVRVNVSTAGVETTGDDFTNSASVSDDGRFATFASIAPTLVAGDTNGFYDVFLHDRDADVDGVFDDHGGILTRRYESLDRLTPANSLSHAISGDGRYAVASFGTDVLVQDNVTQLTARAATPLGGGLLTGQVSFPVSISRDGQFIAFASNDPNLVPGDTNGAPDLFVYGTDTSDLTKDLTGDGDLNDTVLQVLDATAGPGAAPLSLCPAGAVSVANGAAAFLRPEAAGAAPGCPSHAPSLNGDADQTDEVVHLWANGAVRNLECAAKVVSLSSRWVGALVAEAAQGDGDLNGDGDTRDTVAFVHRVAGPFGDGCTGMQSAWLNLGRSARTVKVVDAEVAGGEVRSIAVVLTRERDEGASLNGDADLDDLVLQLFELDSAANTAPKIDGLAFAVEHFATGGTFVAFGVSEAGQGGALPLNDDGDVADEVLFVYDLADGELHEARSAVTPCPRLDCDPSVPYRVGRDSVRFVTREADEGRDLDNDGAADGLVVRVFNVRTGTVTTLRPLPGDDVAEDPLADDPGPGVIEDEGRCIETLGQSCQAGCAIGAFCDVGTCARDHGVCFTNADCPANIACRPDPTVIAEADRDADGITDAFDNCPDQGNASQTDGDVDGVGDACDRQTCGNGNVEVDEACDDGNRVDGDGCNAACRAGCAPAPLSGCLKPIAAKKSALLVKHGKTAAKDSVAWKWTKGAATTTAEFGDPRAATGYTFCLYEESSSSPRLVLQAAAPAAGACPAGKRKTRPCWKAAGKGNRLGYQYGDSAATPDGISKLTLKPGIAGKSSVQVLAKGTLLAGRRLGLPTLPLPLPLRAQLQSLGGQCWEATYRAAKKNDPAQLKAISD